ncbi:splicing factor C9orf78 homolog [Sitodiplosis mosellana]|uniref:splicing factor C9orf78 homolog n=1 Tax=Sitodiplosis mosellana TaxID=263140 RepID=UPI002443F928|nr:splicing factor C9orf78 homolog [Sitodiplosis mosellana]
MSEEIKFKPKKVKNLRTRRNSSDDDDEKREEDVLAKLEETKLAQKLRAKPHGVNAVALAIGQKVTAEDLVLKNDPFKMKSGGMINMKNIKSGKVQQVDDAYDVGIGTQFSAETNKRDEDEEMMKYIEEQLNKRKNSKLQSESGGDNDNETYNDEKYLSPEEAALLSLPEHLRVSSTHRSEEMLSNQMLNGIPEVDLGIEIKIKNIEATEAAKEKLLRDQKNKKSAPSHFVPSNIAVNFSQHNRFNIEDAETKRRRQKMQEDRERQGNGNQKPGIKRATDDYHYDKFRKQFRRY